MNKFLIIFNKCYICVKKIKDYRLRLVRVKVFPENILFSGNAIFWKGKCFHVFGCISKNVSKNIL